MAGQGWTDKRPMSPHLQVWKFHPTMFVSILHRATGVANAVGLAMIIGWLFATASGEKAFAAYDAFFTSIFGLIILFGFTVSLFFHFANGIRYLFWDSGKGFDPETANLWSYIALAFGFLGASALWVLVHFMTAA